MFLKNLSDETRYVLLFIFGLAGLLAVMIFLNTFFKGESKTKDAEKSQEKTIIITEANKKAASPEPLPKSVVSTVRDALKQGNYSTVYMEINNVSKSSPEYEELRKQLEDLTRQRKTPGVRKDAGASPSAPVRYFDESTPRNRSTDSIYIYFIDIAGTLVPRFCIQATAKKPLGINRFTITADNKKFEIIASPIKQENIEKGIAEWYDVPLDRYLYEAVQAVLKAKESTLVISGSIGKKNHDITESEKNGFRRILDGYAALGGNSNYFQDNKVAPPHSQNKRQGGTAQSQTSR